MEPQAQTATYSGWTLLELMGHNREAGYLSTLYFGAVALLQVDVPEIPAREETLTRPQWVGSQLLPVGTVIAKEAIPGRSFMLNPSAIYRAHPATEEAVRAAIAANQPREIKVISIPQSAQRTLLPGELNDDEGTEDGSDTDDFD
jgi:hypothetical protein